MIGVGAVSVLEPDPSSILVRDCGRPLVWTDLHLDQLVDGWSVDLASREVTPVGRADAVAWDGSAVANDPGDWWVDGDHAPHEERFGWVVERAPSAFATHAGRDTPVQQDTLGVVDANDTDARGPALARAAIRHRPPRAGRALTGPVVRRSR